jgi:HAD superfamily hydrolase (TIGR01509 family)
VSPGLPPSLRAVVFDVGNTLHHLDHAFIAQTITATGCPVTTRDVAVAEYDAKAAIDEMFRGRAAGQDETRRTSYFEIIMERLGVPRTDYDAILAALRADDARRSLWRVMYAETPGVLAALRQRGYTLAVVSNADGRVPAALAACGIADHFAAIIDSHLVGVEKPNPRIFELALSACGVEPSRAAYVGDIYEIDVRGARDAGLTPVLIDPLGLYGAVDCVRIRGLAELLDLLPARASGRGEEHPRKDRGGATAGRPAKSE